MRRLTQPKPRPFATLTVPYFNQKTQVSTQERQRLNIHNTWSKQNLSVDGNMTSSSQEGIAVRAPTWMLQPLNSSQYQDMMEIIKDENHRQKLGTKAVLGGVASAISVGVLGHFYLTSSQQALGEDGAGGFSVLQEWFEGLDDELTNLIKCTVVAAYQVEEIGALKTLHQVAVSTVLDMVQCVLLWRSLCGNLYRWTIF